MSDRAPMMPDWLKTPPQITLRSNAIRARTVALLRFNARRYDLPMNEAVQALTDYVDADLMLYALDYVAGLVEAQYV